MVNEEIKKAEQPQKPKVTRAEKAKRQKEIVRLLLTAKDYKWNELLEEATKKYAETHMDETNDLADLKGKIGSSFSLMEESGEVAFDKKTGVCTLVKKEEPKKRGRKKKEELIYEEVKAEKQAEEKLKTRSKKTVKEEVKTEEKTEEKPKKTRSKKTAKEEVLAEKAVEEKAVEKTEEKPQEKSIKEAPVFDLTAVLGSQKEEKKTVAEQAGLGEKKEEMKREEKKPVLPEFVFLGNAGAKDKKEEETPAQKQVEVKREEPKEVKKDPRAVRPKTEIKKLPQNAPRRQTRSERAASLYEKLTPEEKLKVDFLKKLRSLGGEYFEYYSVYLLERYSLKNGRRLEALRVSGGENDGGIDGELELTDKFGFRETLYIQAKNWDDSKGDVEKWTVGETLLQQFVGAVACRQAKEGRRKCRGIFVTTSHFTEGAKEILESMNADFIGYDGDDVFETAKECKFGLIEKDGKWQLDEKLLSGEKAFFDLL